MTQEEIKRALYISFFGLEEDEYEDNKERIDVIIDIGNRLLEAEYNAKEYVKVNLEPEENELDIFISEGVKAKYKWLKDTGDKYEIKLSLTDILD